MVGRNSRPLTAAHELSRSGRENTAEFTDGDACCNFLVAQQCVAEFVKDVVLPVQRCKMGCKGDGPQVAAIGSESRRVMLVYGHSCTEMVMPRRLSVALRMDSKEALPSMISALLAWAAARRASRRLMVRLACWGHDVFRANLIEAVAVGVETGTCFARDEMRLFAERAAAAHGVACCQHGG